MQPKTLLILVFIAMQCIDRSFEVIQLETCSDEVTCVKIVHNNKRLREGIVVFVVTWVDNPIGNSLQQILDFFKEKTELIRVLQVNVKFGQNKIIVSYFLPGVDPKSIVYPFVAVMVNQQIVNGVVYSYNQRGLNSLLNTANDSDDEERMRKNSNFSRDILAQIDSSAKKSRKMDARIRNAILGTEENTNPLPGLPTATGGKSNNSRGTSSTKSAAATVSRKRNTPDADVNALLSVPVLESSRLYNLGVTSNLAEVDSELKPRIFKKLSEIGDINKKLKKKSS